MSAAEKTVEYTAILVNGKICVVEKSIAEQCKKDPESMKDHLPSDTSIVEKIHIENIDTPPPHTSITSVKPIAQQASKPPVQVVKTPAPKRPPSILKPAPTFKVAVQLAKETSTLRPIRPAPIAIFPNIAAYPKLALTTPPANNIFIPRGTVLFVDKNKSLIALYKENIVSYAASNMKRKAVWVNLSQKMKAKGIDWNPAQVKAAWKFLMLRYAESLEDEDIKAKFTYFKEMAEVQKIQDSLTFDKQLQSFTEAHTATRSRYAKTERQPDTPWSKTAVLQLAHSFQQRKELIKCQNEIGENAWRSITEEVNAHGTDYSVQDVKRKWAKLTQMHNKLNMNSESSEISQALINVFQEPGETVQSTLEALETLAAEAAKQTVPPPQSGALDKHSQKVQALMKKSKRLKVFGTVMDTLKEMHTERLHESKLARESRFRMHKQKMKTFVVLTNILKEKLKE